MSAKMLLRCSRFAAAAAAVLHWGSYEVSLASSSSSEDSAAPSKPAPSSETEAAFWDGFRSGAAASSGAQDWFGSLLGPFTSMLNFFGGGVEPFGSGLRMQLKEVDDKSCQLWVSGPGASSGVGSGFGVFYKPTFNTVSVSFRGEETRQTHDPEKGDRVASRSFSGSSTMGLPERCIASPAVLMSHMCGIVCGASSTTTSTASSNSDKKSGCVIVFPSRVLLNEYVQQEAMPEGVISLIESGAEAKLEESLTQQQLCMAMGFTREQCERIGRRPRIDAVPQAPDSSASGIPLPLLDVTLDVL